MGEMNMQKASSAPREGHAYSMNASRASMLLLLMPPLLHQLLLLQALACWVG
jgi:hypothetical protein